jgi:DNA-binding FadR family transcriptional regulator
LAENAATQLFLEMLIKLQNAHVREDASRSGRIRSLDGAEGSVSLAAHRAITEAIIDGDTSLARHRMRRHLEGIDSYLQMYHDGGAAAAHTIDDECL